MIQIRNGLFETNSSSTHSFVYSNDDRLNIPKEVSLSDLNRYGSLDDSPSIKDRLGFFYDLACDNDKGEEFIEYLKSKGITIKQPEKYSYDGNMCSYKYISEEELDHILFNTSVKYYHNENVKKDENEKVVNFREF